VTVFDMFRIFMKKNLSGQRGFTLYEILVVISILAVLCAIVFVNFSGLIGKGTSEASSLEIRNIQTAVAAALRDQAPVAVTPGTLSPTSDVTIGSTTIGAYIKGGNAGVRGTYDIHADGEVTLVSYPY
jgi:prepilin-type N-terminal cleavage/methylation domain-containing protein